MTRLQALLLHSVNFSSSPVRKLTINGEDQGAWFGFRFPYEVEEIFRELFELIENNLMGLELEVADDRVEPIENPTIETLWDSFRQERICYYLTPEGGVLWEQALKVDWDKYVLNSFSRGGTDDELSVVLISPRIENLTFAMEEWLSRYDEVEPGRANIEQIQDWEVSYWKTLPLGFKTTFYVKRKPCPEIATRAPNYLRQRIQWYDDTLLGFEQR